MKTEALGAWSKRLRGVFGRYKFVLLVILAGAALLLLPSVGEKETAAEQTAEQTSLLQSVDALERRLEAALSRMDGAGEVTVVLTVKSSGRQILAQDGKTTERGETTDTQLTGGAPTAFAPISGRPCGMLGRGRGCGTAENRRGGLRPDGVGRG